MSSPLFPFPPPSYLPWLELTCRAQVWNSLDLFETLVELGSDELTEPILRQILDLPIKHVPELVTLAFVQIKVSLYFLFSFSPWVWVTHTTFA